MRSSSSSSSAGSTCCPPVSLIPPGESPLSEPDALVLPVLTLLRRDPRRVDAHGARRDDRGAARRLRADGAAERASASGRSMWRYALRNALAPSVQVFAQNIQCLVGGIIVVEYLFAYPGIGKELVDAVGDPRRARRSSRSPSCSPPIYIVVNIVADLARRAPHPEAADGGMSERPASLRTTARGRRRRSCSSSSSSRSAAVRARSSRRTRPTEPVGIPFERPTAAPLLGTDYLGRDVLSRVLWGGRSVLGARRARDRHRLRRRARDRPRRRLHARLARRAADARRRRPALASRALLFILLLVTGAGTSTAVLVVGVAVVQMPLDRAHRPHGDARAVGARLRRGGGGARRAAARDPPARDPARTSSRRSWPTPACASRSRSSSSRRSTSSASASSRRTADWGLMISENRDGLSAEPVRRSLAPAAADRAPDDRREPGRRRDRAHARALGAPRGVGEQRRSRRRSPSTACASTLAGGDADRRGRLARASGPGRCSASSASPGAARRPPRSRCSAIARPGVRIAEGTVGRGPEISGPRERRMRGRSAAGSSPTSRRIRRPP